MEEEIKSSFKEADIFLQTGSSGDFIVEVDGKVIFSKNDDDKLRFPFENEIVNLLKK